LLDPLGVPTLTPWDHLHWLCVTLWQNTAAQCGNVPHIGHCRCPTTFLHAPHLWHRPVNSITMVAHSHKYWTTSSTMQSCHRQIDYAGWMSPWLAIIRWRLSPSSTSPGIAQTTVEGLADNWSHKSVEGRLAIGYNSTLMVDPTIRLPGFDLHWRQWSLLNHFRTGQDHRNACHKKWRFTNNELSDCGEIQTHIVNSCPLTKFDGGLLHLH